MTNVDQEWLVVSSRDPKKEWLRIAFRSQEGGDDGRTTYEALSEEGAEWLPVVREHIESPDMTFVTEGGQILEGPHDRSERQLAAALAHLEISVPALRVREAGSGAVLGLPDAVLEATKSVIRERFLAAFQELDETEQKELESAVQQMLVPIAKARTPEELRNALSKALDAIKAASLRDFAQNVAMRLQQATFDPELPVYDSVISKFTGPCLRWLVSE